MIISAGTDTYVNGNNSVIIRGNDNSSTNELVVTSSGTTIGGNTVWHAGNDGPSSGLNADLLDGYHESTFMRRSANSQLDMNNNDIVGVDQIIHEGDSDTYIQFHAADQWRVVTGGAERLEVNNSQITSTEPIHAPSFHGDGSNLTNLPSSGLTMGDNGTIPTAYAFAWDGNTGVSIDTSRTYGVLSISRFGTGSYAVDTDNFWVAGIATAEYDEAPFPMGPVIVNANFGGGSSDIYVDSKYFDESIFFYMNADYYVDISGFLVLT
jgi:hypothetical protein